MGHVSEAEAFVEFPAGLTRLAYFKQRRSRAPQVADADVSFGQAFRRDVLPERARLFENSVPYGFTAVPVGLLRKFGPPVGIMIEWVMVDRLVRPAMMFRIGLLVPNQTERSDFNWLCDLFLVNRARLAAREGLDTTAQQRPYRDGWHRHRVSPSSHSTNIFRPAAAMR